MRGNCNRAATTGAEAQVDSELYAAPKRPIFHVAGLGLAAAGGRDTGLWVNIPENFVFGEAFDTDFALHLCACAATPDHAKLALGALVLHIHHIARFEPDVDALQGRAAAADGTQAGGLGVGSGIGVHAPNHDGQVDGNALLLAPVHANLRKRQSRSGAGESKGNRGHHTTVPVGLLKLGEGKADVTGCAHWTPRTAIPTMSVHGAGAGAARISATAAGAGR